MNKNIITASIWTWGTETREQMELAAKEISEIGYTTFESVLAAIHAYDMDIDAYKETLKKYNITPVSFYVHLKPLGREQDLWANIDKELEFMANLGVERISLQGSSGRPEVMNEEMMEYELKTVERFAKKSKEFGITSNIHPHHNTFVMHENEIDNLMQNISSDILSFCPDTAHLVAGLCDPVKVIEKYADRVNFTHFKDIKDANVISQGMAAAGMEVYSNFCELGQGGVDFKAVFDVLKKANYDGPLCEELDCPPISNASTAKNNYDFLVNNY